MQVVRALLLSWVLPVLGGFLGFFVATTNKTLFIVIGVAVGVVLAGGIEYLVRRRSA